MKYRIISDLHVDINSQYIPLFKFDPKAYYLIAGDISGGRELTASFLRQLRQNKKLNKAVFVEGNHMGYNFEWEFNDLSKEGCYVYLSNEFTLDESVSFLENKYKEVPKQNTIIIGCTLYTDYMLYGNKEYAMRLGAKSLNDFRYVKTYGKYDEYRIITPEDYLKRHHESIAYIDKICMDNPTKNIIVVTHHGVSRKSLDGEYVNDILSSSYVSDLEPFILAHPNIKLWVHGHVHRHFNYNIGECKVICNPFGYYNENNMRLSRYIGEVYEL